MTKPNGGIGMCNLLAGGASLRNRLLKTTSLAAMFALAAGSALSQGSSGGEAGLQLPDLSQVSFLGVDGHKLLLWGILFCFFGLAFGLTIYVRLKNLPAHRSMLEISELIYETCK